MKVHKKNCFSDRVLDSLVIGTPRQNHLRFASNIKIRMITPESHRHWFTQLVVYTPVSMTKGHGSIPPCKIKCPKKRNEQKDNRSRGLIDWGAASRR